MQHRLFVYGTLQIPERVAEITGRHLSGVPAQLDGYRCGRVVRADFPGIVPHATGRTFGQLLSGLGQDDLSLLDRYEGELYRRIRVGVTVADFTSSAWVYVIVPWAYDRVSNEPWSVEWYVSRHPKTRWTYRT